MELHGNAALSLIQRRRLAGRVVLEGWTLAEAAQAAEVSVRTAQKWSSRFRVAGEAGLLDRSSATRSCPHATSEDRVQAIASLRALRLTGTEIAEVLRGTRSLPRSLPADSRSGGPVALSDNRRETSRGQLASRAALRAGPAHTPSAHSRPGHDRSSRPRVLLVPRRRGGSGPPSRRGHPGLDLGDLPRHQEVVRARRYLAA